MREDAVEQSSSGRIHGLDALRGVLMLLGVVLHTVLNYLPGPPGGGWGFRDPGASAGWTHFVLDVIHAFRMPAFFVISGFFGALLWYGRGARAMLQNRFARLVLPFVAFLLLLWPAVIFSFTFAAGITNGTVEPLEYAGETTWKYLFPPGNTMHLWFVYHLTLITGAVTAAVAWMERRGMSRPAWMERLRAAAENPWRSLGIFGLLNLLWFGPLGWQDLPTSASWFPAPLILSYYLGCYSLGWIFYVTRVDLDTLKARAWTFVALGVGCTCLRFIAYPLIEGYEPQEGVIPAPGVILGFTVRVVAAAVAVVLLTRGFAGLFMRYASSGSYGWRYVSDSSYWVYLIHLPLSVLIPGLLVGWEAHVLLKWVTAMTLVSGLCLATYDFGVRATFVGRFLNGRRYPRYSLGLGALGTMLAVASVAYGLTNIAPVNERPSIWLKGEDPQKILPDEKVVFPLAVQGAAPENVHLARCVGVGRYAICPDAADYDGAQEGCQALGGQLVVMDDEAENKAVSEMLWKLTKRIFWLGIDDREEEGTWRERGGTIPDFGGWHEGQPDDYGDGQDCATGNWRKKGKWDDLDCGARTGFVCEFDTALSAPE